MHRGTFDLEPALLAERHHDDVVLLKELAQALLTALANTRLGWRGIDVVGVDLERHQVERHEAGWLHYRHVVGRADRRARHIGTRAGAEVRDTTVDRGSNRPDEREPVEGADQPEAVAAGDEDRLRISDRLRRISEGVDAGDLDTVRREPFGESGRGAIVIALGVRDHHRSTGTPEMFEHRRPRRGDVAAGVEDETSGHACRDLLGDEPLSAGPEDKLDRQAGQTVAGARRPRKVRAPQSRALGNAQSG